MAFKTRVLVLANQTADSEGLVEALRRRAERGDVTFKLLVPAGKGGGSDARRQLEAALERFAAAGLEVDGQVCDADLIVAVNEVWDPGEFDEVIISTLARDSSRWLEADLPHRIARLTDAPVQHVVPAEIERALARQRVARPRHHEPQRALGPFAGPAVK
jgi:K+-sensing histidine kinase KdpD